VPVDGRKTEISALPSHRILRETALFGPRLYFAGGGATATDAGMIQTGDGCRIINSCNPATAGSAISQSKETQN